MICIRSSINALIYVCSGALGPSMLCFTSSSGCLHCIFDVVLSADIYEFSVVGCIIMSALEELELASLNYR